MGRAVTRVVLLSGGIDSTVCLRLASRDDFTTAVIVDYGQQNRTELVLAGSSACRYGRPGLRNGPARIVCKLPMQAGLISGDIDRGRTVVAIGAPGDVPKAYTPGRNTVLLALALHVAEHEGAQEIWIGANRDDYNGFPDCRREYFDAFEAICASMGKKIVIKTPLINLTKREVVALGRELGVDFAHTSSCYFGTECGDCDACVLRKHALENT